ncbi:fam-h protein [Plasmodium relictum]|uniref:Fam-h protein n=1 Tax=Plasmodium relictum TaxID=85471 RepID=A0A1J1GKC2_PLARL|nr:fam-h protein [Plasmodium relictum]CRG85017.1 fam-h protein [Plasmodium relictum]
MSSKINSISNISAYPEPYPHVYKGYITIDMSTRKIYNKKEKKYISYFLIKFFLFTLLIWILQCFNNWDSCRWLNYKNEKTNKLILGAERSLAENNDKVKQRKEELKCSAPHVIVKTDLEPKYEQVEMGEYIDTEQGDEIETKKENKEETHNEKKLGKYSNISKAYSLFFSFVLSLASFLLSIVYLITKNEEIYSVIFICVNLSIIIYLILLTFEEIKKRKNKSKL